MIHQFTFNMKSNISYLFQFFTMNEGVHRMFFQGVPFFEVIKYTSRFLELSPKEKINIYSELLKLIYVDVEGYKKDTKKVENYAVAIKDLLLLVSEILVEGLKQDTQILEYDAQNVSKRAKDFVEYVIESHLLNTIKNQIVNVTENLNFSAFGVENQSEFHNKSIINSEKHTNTLKLKSMAVEKHTKIVKTRYRLDLDLQSGISFLMSRIDIEKSKTIIESTKKISLSYLNEFLHKKLKDHELQNEIKFRDGAGLVESISELIEKGKGIEVDKDDLIKEFIHRGTEIDQEVLSKDFKGTEIEQEVLGKDFIGTEIEQEIVDKDFIGTEIEQEVLGKDFIGTEIDQELLGKDFNGTEIDQEIVHKDFNGTEIVQEVLDKDFIGTEIEQEVLGKDFNGTEIDQEIVHKDFNGTEIVQEVLDKDFIGTEIEQEIVHKDLKSTELLRELMSKDLKVTELLKHELIKFYRQLLEIENKENIKIENKYVETDSDLLHQEKNINIETLSKVGIDNIFGLESTESIKLKELKLANKLQEAESIRHKSIHGFGEILTYRSKQAEPLAKKATTEDPEDLIIPWRNIIGIDQGQVRLGDNINNESDLYNKDIEKGKTFTIDNSDQFFNTDLEEGTILIPTIDVKLWDTGKTYSKGDLVTYQGKVYEVTETHTSNEFNELYFKDRVLKIDDFIVINPSESTELIKLIRNREISLIRNRDGEKIIYKISHLRPFDKIWLNPYKSKFAEEFETRLDWFSKFQHWFKDTIIDEFHKSDGK
jgi:hypothetical protein